MRKLLIILLSACSLFACNDDDTPTPQPQTNTGTTPTPADTFSGTLITKYHSGTTHTWDTIENCQLISTIYGDDSAMRIRMTFPYNGITTSLIAQSDISLVFTDAFGTNRTGVDSCTQLLLKIAADDNSVDYEQTYDCEPGTDLFFTGAK